MFLLAFFALLRIGEFTKTGLQMEQSHLPQNQDVTIHKRTLHVTMRSFKHSSSCPTTLCLASQSGVLCPVKAIKDYKEMRGSSDGSLFIFSSGQPITRAFFMQYYVHALRWANMDPHRYKSHSFRIGAATTAATRGLTDAQIQAMGRWKSNAYKRYIRIPTLSCSLT